MAEGVSRILHWLFAVLILVFVILSGFQPVMNNVDLGWHVAQGRWMIQHVSIYRHDAFNYPNLGHAAIDEYPLFQVVLYLFWSLGWWGPCLLTAAVDALLFWALLKAARSFGLHASALFAIAVAMLPVYGIIASPLRPHLVTYLCLAILGIFLLRHREARSWTLFWPMALMQVAWTNCHSGFVIGPVLVGLFGAEMIVRHWIREKTLPLKTIQTWLGAFLLILLACFINPFGAARFYPPFYQDGLESIRAYVGEMEPLTGGLTTLYQSLTLIAFLIVALAILIRRGAVSFSFLLLALVFYAEALSAKKAWPVFGLFAPLLVLSSGAFAASFNPRKIYVWFSLAGHVIVVVLLGLVVKMRVDGSPSASLQSLWKEYDHGRSELSIEAADWLRVTGIDGRLFHRSEDGGWLQLAGYDQGQTFGDTGFGKYDEDFIHEVGLVGERPALLPQYLQAYRPDYVICGTFCYQWPYYLRQKGWRLIFYSTNSSVWAQAATQPQRPTISDQEVVAAFTEDIAKYGMPSDFRLYGRNILALNSMGLEDFAFTTLKVLPQAMHQAPWYWEAARILCLEQPAFSPRHRDALLQEAAQLHEDNLTAEFRAWCAHAAGDGDGARRILEGIPQNQLGNSGAELLLKIDLDQNRPEALALAQRVGCFDLRNGRHWQYLAEAEDRAGHSEAAARAWTKAVFYYPDDADLMRGAQAFANKSHDAGLQQAIARSSKIYGQTF